MKIAIVADKDTITCFRLSGIENAFPVKNAEEAEKLLNELLETHDFALIIITHKLTNRIRAKINEITEEKQFPLIISIPSISDHSELEVDPINELIRRKTGIELKL